MKSWFAFRGILRLLLLRDAGTYAGSIGANRCAIDIRGRID